MTTTEAAAVLRDAHEYRDRADGTRYWTLRDDLPAHVEKIAYDGAYNGHGDLLPTDGGWETYRDALAWIAEEGDDDDDAHAFADHHVSLYHADRAAWLADAPITRLGICDAAANEYGTAAEVGISDRIALGWYAENIAVYHAAREAAETLARGA
jgi:hypothetical protein